MVSQPLSIVILPDSLAVVRLSPAQSWELPWIKGNNLVALIRTAEELTVVCLEEGLPRGILVETGWRAMKVNGQLAFSMVGILASLAVPLAKAGISIFSLSTYDTDYLLVKQEKLMLAVSALQTAGFEVIDR